MIRRAQVLEVVGFIALIGLIAVVLAAVWPTP